MPPILRNILALITGLVIGSLINRGIILTGPHVIAAPIGVDMTNIKKQEAAFDLLEPRHFIFPFVAHTMGTFAASFLAALLAASHKMKIALIVGGLFLTASFVYIFLRPSAFWFSLLDLNFAYMPAAYLGGLLAQRAARQR